MEKELAKVSKKYIQKAAEKTAKQVYSKIQDFHQQATKDFYDDYKPISYERTYATYASSSAYSSNILTDTGIEIVGDSYITGITVSPDNILKSQGDPYSRKNHPVDTGWVLYRTWWYGIHGKRTIMTTRPAPHMRLKTLMEDYARSAEIQNIFNANFSR